MEIDRHLAGCLDGIAMHQGPCRPRQAHDLRYRLNHSGLVIGQHDRNQSRVGGGRQKALQRRQIDNAMAIDGNRLRTSPRLAGRCRARPPRPASGAGQPLSGRGYWLPYRLK